MFAVLIPSAEIPAIWDRQRQISSDLIRRGLAGSLTSNHATNGSSPTLYLQDDRQPFTPSIARALWQWPGVINVMALPRTNQLESDFDTIEDLAATGLGRDGADPIEQTRSGYPRNPRVRAAVRDRAQGRCERENCGEQRDYPGFLDVHHLLGIEVSDRVWTCVALCPNCHREAHFSPERDAINDSLLTFASQFAPPQ